MNAEGIKNLVFHEVSIMPEGVSYDPDGRNILIEFNENDLDEGMTATSLKDALKPSFPFEITIIVNEGE